MKYKKIKIVICVANKVYSKFSADENNKKIESLMSELNIKRNSKNAGGGKEARFGKDYLYGETKVYFDVGKKNFCYLDGTEIYGPYIDKNNENGKKLMEDFYITEKDGKFFFNNQMVFFDVVSKCWKYYKSKNEVTEKDVKLTMILCDKLNNDLTKFSITKIGLDYFSNINNKRVIFTENNNQGIWVFDEDCEQGKKDTPVWMINPSKFDLKKYNLGNFLSSKTDTINVKMPKYSGSKDKSGGNKYVTVLEKFYLKYDNKICYFDGQEFKGFFYIGTSEYEEYIKYLDVIKYDKGKYFYNGEQIYFGKNSSIYKWLLYENNTIVKFQQTSTPSTAKPTTTTTDKTKDYEKAIKEEEEEKEQENIKDKIAELKKEKNNLLKNFDITKDENQVKVKAMEKLKNIENNFNGKNLNNYSAIIDYVKPFLEKKYNNIPIENGYHKKQDVLYVRIKFINNKSEKICEFDFFKDKKPDFLNSLLGKDTRNFFQLIFCDYLYKFRIEYVNEFDFLNVSTVGNKDISYLNSTVYNVNCGSAKVSYTLKNEIESLLSEGIDNKIEELESKLGNDDDEPSW